MRWPSREQAIRRVEAVIDATQKPPQVVFMRDLTELGRGFSAQLLTTGAASVESTPNTCRQGSVIET
jgi:hypothetical protein